MCMVRMRVPFLLPPSFLIIRRKKRISKHPSQSKNTLQSNMCVPFSGV